MRADCKRCDVDAGGAIGLHVGGSEDCAAVEEIDAAAGRIVIAKRGRDGSRQRQILTGGD